jgi:hypothetical protein
MWWDDCGYVLDNRMWSTGRRRSRSMTAGNRDISVGRMMELDSFIQSLVDDLKISATKGVAAKQRVYDNAINIMYFKTSD